MSSQSCATRKFLDEKRPGCDVQSMPKSLRCVMLRHRAGQSIHSLEHGSAQKLSRALPPACTSAFHERPRPQGQDALLSRICSGASCMPSKLISRQVEPFLSLRASFEIPSPSRFLMHLCLHRSTYLLATAEFLRASPDPSQHAAAGLNRTYYLSQSSQQYP